MRCRICIPTQSMRTKGRKKAQPVSRLRSVIHRFALEHGVLGGFGGFFINRFIACIDAGTG